jgi:Concanavalin A-like lectin/glucanases superfamily/Bacterial Ig-like domain (group 2)
MKTPSSLITKPCATIQALVAVAMTLLLASSSFAGINQFSIGLNLGSDGGNNPGTGSLNPGDVAGLPAVAQANWNNLAAVSGSLPNVTDNNGNATSAGVAWFSGTGTWSSGGNNAFVSTNDHTLMQGYLDNGGTATVTITNIPSQLTSGYDVYVYALFDTANRGGTYSIVDGLNTSTVLRTPRPLNSDANPTNYVQVVGAGTVQTGNYMVFRGLTNANIQVQAVATNTGTARAIICAVQLVAAPSTGESGAATGLSVVTNGQPGQLTISWTPGAGSSGSLVVLRRGLPETAQPVDGVVYNADPTVGNGDNLGDDETGNGNYAVYSGSASSVIVSNLIPTQTYYAAVYSYNGSGVSINYTLANPPTGNATASGSATNILLVVPAPIFAGSAKNFQVLAQYQNGTTFNVAASATVTSSNAAIISILGAGRLGALTNGTVGLTAIYSGVTNIQVVTVSPMSMTYQWSFNEPTAELTVTDSVAQAVGYVTNSPFSGPDGSGKLVLDGGGGYVALPPNILSNYGGLTIETWATETTAATWERLWDFGSGQTVNMFMTPNAGGGFLRTAFTVGGGGAEQQVNYPFNPDPTRHQFVFTLSGATRTGKIFLDGVQVGVNTNFTLTPEDLGPLPNIWIGRSQYPDPFFTGSYDEFRIYNGPLSAMQIALDAATGPDIITNNPGALTSISISGNSPIPQFGIEQLSVTGIFANVSSPVNLTSVEGIRYFTSDPNIGIVNPAGLFTATGPGTVQIRTTLLGSALTNSVFITVNQIPPGMTHRWPFNTDYNDLLGGAPAIPHGTVSLDGLGNAVLDGQGAANTAGSYVELPANLLLGYTSVALEAWYTDACGDGTGINRNWARLWDFGSGQGNNLFITPFVNSEVDTMRLALNTNNVGEWTLHCVRPLTNVEHHIVFVLDGTNRVATLYVDGKLVSYNRNFLTRPRDLGPTPNDWLGRSQYPDPIFQGLIDEFRIYNGTIDPLQIGIDYVTGPNNLVTNPGSLLSVSVALTTNMVADHPQNAQALATFASVSGVPVTTLATNWSSSDPTVARVNQNGLITAIGAGSASISATYRGVTGNATVNVAGAPPPILSHRYSFDLGDARDTGVVGGGDGTVVGGPTFANGMLTIADVNSYISLPGHLFDTNLEVTLETWCVVAANSGSGSRMCDFGTSLAGPSTFAIVPTANGNNYISFRTEPNTSIGGPPSINSFGRPAFGTTNHYAFVVSDLKRRVDIYLNGVLKDSYPYDSSQPGTLQSANVQYRYMLGYLTNNMTEGWFGKNVNGTTGAGWFGSIDEFRIWNGPLDKVQVQVSYLKGPGNPSIDPGALQSLSVALSDTTMVVGAIQRPSVSGTFANVGQSLDLTTLPGVVFTSSDSSKVAVVNGGDTKLQAVGIGSANIVASYGGKSVTNTVTVIQPQTVVAHRYSFRGNMNDSIGHANGALFGNALLSGGKLVLDGTPNPPTYARLPSDLISGYNLLTLEAFYSVPVGSSGSQQRLWDFGDHIEWNGAPNVAGTAYFYEAAGRGAAGLPSNLPGGGEAAAIAPNTNQTQFTTNVIHVAATVDSPNHILNLYTNGALAMSVTNVVIDLGLVADNFSFLGRSQWGGDPHLNGSIDDFRVYYGVLTPAQIAASYAAGPDPETLRATVAGANQVTISWPATLVTAAYSLQSSSSLTSGIWSNVGGVTQVGANYQVTVNSAGAPLFFRLIK